MKKTRILFLCIHNSARSQMAEAYMKQLGGDKYEVESAGLEAGKLNLYAVEVMNEDGIDISKNETNDVFEYYKEGRLYEYVITVCDEASAAACPIFPGVHQKISWSFPDPSQFAGSYDERLKATRLVRDTIKNAVIDLIAKLG